MEWIHVLYRVDTSAHQVRPKPPSLLQSLFSPASRSLRKTGFRARSRGSAAVPDLCLVSCCWKMIDELVQQVRRMREKSPPTDSELLA